MNEILVASVYVGGFMAGASGQHYSNHAAVTYDVGDLSLDEWVTRLRLEALTMFDLPIDPSNLLVSVRASRVVNGVMVETLTC